MTPIIFLNPLPWPLCAALILAGLGVLWLTWQESGTRRLPLFLRFLLLGLRALVLILIGLLLCDPARSQGRNSQNDWLGVILDGSASMQVRDPEVSAGRLEVALKALLHAPSWKHLNSLYPARYFIFDRRVRELEGPKTARTTQYSSRLFSALTRLESQHADDSKLIGWILISDGNATDTPAAPEHFFKTLNRAVTVIAAGQPGPVSNIQMQAPEVTPDVFAGQKIPLHISWQAQAAAGTQTSLEVKLQGKLIFRDNVQVKSGAFDVEVPVDDEGVLRLEIFLSPLPDEVYTEDNHVTVWLESHPRKIRVFYAESFYKDENAFKKALEEDKDFEVHFASSLTGFAKEKAVPFVLDPLYGLPADKNRLMDYDVLVLSDVKRALLKNDQMTWIREWVQDQGGALIMVGGLDSFGDGGYARSPLEAMLPVEISEQYQKDIFLKARRTVDQPFRIQPAPGALEHPLLQLTGHAALDKKLWNSMPLLGGYNYVGRLKPGAQLLWQHPADKSRYGPRVILAVQSFGRGRVLAFTSDITPNWGTEFLNWKNAEQGWLYAWFWRNALKWLSRNRIDAKTEPLSVKQNPALATADEPLSFQFISPEGMSGRGSFELYQNTQRIALDSFDLLPGMEKPVFSPGRLKAGDYHLLLRLAPEGKPPLLSRHYFTVHASRLEAGHLEANPELLQTLACQSGGNYLPAGSWNGLEAAVKKMQRRQLKQSAEPIWNNVWIYGAILAMVFCEWLIRKKKGLEP